MASRPSKRRKLTPPPSDSESLSGGNDAKIQKSFFQNAAGWNLEHDYESRKRKGTKKKDKGKVNSSHRLPVKTAGGAWVEQDDVEHVPSDVELPGSGDDDGPDEHDARPNEPAQAAALRAAEEPRLSEREQIKTAQEEIAKIATQLNEDPEEHGGAFKALAKIGESTRLVSVQKLCIVAQLSVYKDVIPGYRIRPVSEESGGLISKDVRKVRAYEQALVTGYRGYIKTLAKFAASPSPAGAAGSAKDNPGQSISSIAISCACALLDAVPHFNFRGDVLRILVRKLSNRRPDASFAKCLDALQALFRHDEEGRPSMEAVSLLAKMMRAREYRVDENVMNLFLHLRLLSEFSGKASKDAVSRNGEDGNPAASGMAGLNGKRSKKEKSEFRTKRERKIFKEQKAAEKVMAHADASVSHEERDQMQSETLKIVFATYFRVLKQRSPHLMGAVLEGLAKYAHLINQDFFGDLLEALKDLIRHSDEDADHDRDEQVADEDVGDGLVTARNTSREALLCTVTAFALLAGQDAHNARSDLHLDLSSFTSHLYRGLLSLCVSPDLELSAKSLHLPDPHPTSGPADATATANKDNKVNYQTTTVLLLRCLSAVLLPSWSIRSVPPLRLAAFSKQLMTAALQVPERSAQAALGLLHDVARTHGRKIAALWNTEERRGDGAYNPLSDSVEGSNPFATTVWEGELLRRHYCPKVREAVRLVEKELKGL